MAKRLAAALNEKPMHHTHIPSTPSPRRNGKGPRLPTISPPLSLFFFPPQNPHCSSVDIHSVPHFTHLSHLGKSVFAQHHKTPAHNRYPGSFACLSIRASRPSSKRNSPLVVHPSVLQTQNRNPIDPPMLGHPSRLTHPPSHSTTREHTIGSGGVMKAGRAPWASELPRQGALAVQRSGEAGRARLSRRARQAGPCGPWPGCPPPTWPLERG